MTRNIAARKGPSPNPAAVTKAKAPRNHVKAKALGNPVPKQAPAATVKRPAKRATQTPVAATSPIPSPSRDSKQAQLIASLRRAPGVTIGQMMALTGWQAHTVRGTISGVLRKKLGLKVACERPPTGGERLYRIIEAVAHA